MSTVLYEVGVTFHDPALAPKWLAWLKDGHIADVMRGGATSARIIELDPADPGSDPRYVVQYEFASRRALDTYLSEHAPRLRAEGLAKFAPPAVTYDRRVGTLHWST